MHTYEFTGGTPETFSTLTGLDIAVTRATYDDDGEVDGHELVTVSDGTFVPGDIVELDEPIYHARLIPADDATGKHTAALALADNPDDALPEHLAQYAGTTPAEVIGEEAVPAVAGMTMPDGEAPPFGTRDEVLAWVGDDEAKAAVALAVENASDEPRITLVSALERVIFTAAQNKEG